MSTFDKIYRSALPMKFFSKGWGKPELLLSLIENMRIITDRNKFNGLYSKDAEIIIEEKIDRKRVVVLEGSFLSPFRNVIPDTLFDGNKIARFQMILPRQWASDLKPVCIHFSGTGDHTYSRRRIFLANQLLADGIASIIIMNPYYWKRKPEDQRGSSLNFVSDLFVMGGALIMECHALLNWCQRNGYGPLALHGISMGGYMATLCASVWPRPISLIPCLSWTTASVVFVEGILAGAVDWNILSKQYFADSVYSEVIRPLIQPAISPSVQSANCLCDQTVNLFSDQNKEINSPFTETSTVDLVTKPVPSKSSSNIFLFQSLPTALRYPLDNGISLIRSLPDTLTTSHSDTDPEVKEFLRDLMDFFTHIGNFSRIVDPRLLLSVTAEYDAYVPRKGVCSLTTIYPDAQIRLLLHSGHVGAYVRNAIWTKDFRQAITDCLDLQTQLYYNTSEAFIKPNHPKISNPTNLKPDNP